MSNNKTSQMILMYIYSAVMGIALSFGFFMFSAWLGMLSFDKDHVYPSFFPISGASWIICFVVFVLFMILWIIALIKQKDKLITAGVSALFGGAGMGVGFIAFAFLSAMATMT